MQKILEILTGFQYTVHSNKISGLSPLALIRSFLSFKACLEKKGHYCEFISVRIHSNDMYKSPNSDDLNNNRLLQLL